MLVIFVFCVCLLLGEYYFLLISLWLIVVVVECIEWIEMFFVCLFYFLIYYFDFEWYEFGENEEDEKNKEGIISM